MGCGGSRFDPKGPAPIDPPDTPKLWSSSGDHKSLQFGNANNRQLEGVDGTASNGRRRSVSSLVKGRRFFKRVAHASIDEGNDGEGETGSDEEEEDDVVVREDSILMMGPGSPSFRVYCDDNIPPSVLPDGSDEETIANVPTSDRSLKGSPVSVSHQTTRKRKGRGGIRNVLRRGGSAGMKKLIHPASTRSGTTTHHHHERPVHGAIARAHQN